MSFNNNARKHITSGMSKSNNSGDRYINHVNGKKNEQNIEKENRGSSGAKDYLMRDHQRNEHQPVV